MRFSLIHTLTLFSRPLNSILLMHQDVCITVSPPKTKLLYSVPYDKFMIALICAKCNSFVYTFFIFVLINKYYVHILYDTDTKSVYIAQHDLK